MSLKKKIEQDLKVPVRVRMGAPGSLDVLLDGNPIYSKKQSGRMPTGEELVALIRAKG